MDSGNYHFYLNLRPTFCLVYYDGILKFHDSLQGHKSEIDKNAPNVNRKYTSTLWPLRPSVVKKAFSFLVFELFLSQ